MASDDSREASRAPSRDNRSSNASILARDRGPSAPILPLVRSYSQRNQGIPTTNAGPPALLRPIGRFQGRYNASAEPSFAEGDEDFQSLYNWEEEYSLLEQHGQNSAQNMGPFGTGHNVRPRSPVDNAQSSPFGDSGSSNTRTTPASELSHPSPYPSQRPGSREDSRRAKRRKVDTDRLANDFRGFRYGKYGQVEPGPLTMELVSCDGGMYSDSTTAYVAENILKNDNSVYCTEGPRCNIVLRHQGATPFTLKELVIKAPKNNYTSPVQAGMVFVSMASDHLLSRTAQYQIQYSPPRSSSRRVGRGLEPLNPIISIRHNADGTTMTRAQVRARRLYHMGLEDEDHEQQGVAQIPSEFNLAPAPFQVTTECSDDEADEPNARTLNARAPNRIGSLPFESDSDDDAESDAFSLSRADYQSRRRRNRSSMALAEAAEAAQLATQEAVRAVGGELMTPHARFYIERQKSRCTIQFDPPVSGRFILLKMWNPHRSANANIDIQAVVAKGYAGPRLFPSIELR
ncbi:hypothetical protein GGS20DRAFT_544363 [Poronia punctata]|nr:hypothetical protein GGS20DRAFT_544363 [Poronia punctata]